MIILIVMQTIVGIYFVIINCVTIALIGIDKWRAHGRKQRISEKMLFKMFALGGVVGGLIGMGIFRHKTSKQSFIQRVRLISIIWIILITSIIIYAKPLPGI